MSTGIPMIHNLMLEQVEHYCPVGFHKWTLVQKVNQPEDYPYELECPMSPDCKIAQKVRLAVDWDARIRLVRRRETGFGNFRNLSEAVSAARNIMRSQAEEWDHLDDFGPGHECGPILKKACDKEWAEFEKKLGMSFDQLYEAVAARTTERWAHYNLM